MSELAEKEAGVAKAIQEGDTDSAVAGLYDLIVAYAKNKDFVKAEALRDRLYEVAPMALTEIVKSGDILEQEKCESRDEGHMETFSGLYAALLTEEANAVYYALSHVSLETDQPLFEEGRRNTRLYLIDQGEVKLTIGKGDREALVKDLGPGDMVGGETFFSRTAFCTYAAIAMSAVRAAVLEQSMLASLRESFPGLEGKLQDHYFRAGGIQDLLDRKDMDRRTQDRVSLSGTLVAQLLNKEGKPVGKPFKGGFSDISQGGLSFGVRISKPETARLLLGRRLAVTCRLPVREDHKDLRIRGRIIGLQPHPFNEYSVSVRFDQGLSDDLINSLDTTSDARGPELELKIPGSE